MIIKGFQMVDADEIITQIDKLEDIYLQTKSFFPALNDSFIGKSTFDTALYYHQRGYNVTIHTGKEITRDFVRRYNNIGRWINENAIIRLYGILNYHGLLDSVDKTMPGWKEVDIMRRMRNVFTKTQLDYKPNDKENIRLREEVIYHFNLSHDVCSADEIPTPVDKVVQPIFEGCRKYVRKKCEGA